MRRTPCRILALSDLQTIISSWRYRCQKTKTAAKMKFLSLSRFQSRYPFLFFVNLTLFSEPPYTAWEKIGIKINRTRKSLVLKSDQRCKKTQIWMYLKQIEWNSSWAARYTAILVRKKELNLGRVKLLTHTRRERMYGKQYFFDSRWSLKLVIHGREPWIDFAWYSISHRCRFPQCLRSFCHHLSSGFIVGSLIQYLPELSGPSLPTECDCPV